MCMLLNKESCQSKLEGLTEISQWTLPTENVRWPIVPLKMSPSILDAIRGRPRGQPADPSVYVSAPSADETQSVHDNLPESER